MELTHSFTVPVGIDQAFEVLTDIERIAPCMPGASIESVEGEEFTGRVKVKVGPMQITYRGKARFKELDREQHRAVIDARGQEMRGSGTANATITASLLEKGAETDVTVVSALSITGRPAQFGRGVMNEVGAKLLGQFADCLSTRLGSDDQGATDELAAADVADTAPREPVTPDIDVTDTPEVTEPVTAADVTDPAVPEVTEPVTADVDDTTELTPVASPGSNGSGALTDEEITQVAGVATTQPVTAPEQAASASGPPEAIGGAAQAAGRQTPPRETWSSSTDEAIDLFSVAGPSVVKRLAPIAAVLLLLLLWRRRRSH